MKNLILNLAKPTPGDEHFYTRWGRVGEVMPVESAQFRSEATILVVDQYHRVDDIELLLYPRLIHVVSATTGHTHLTFNNPSIRILSLRGETAFLKKITSTAEHTIYLLMRLAKEVSSPPIKIADKVLGVIGYGRVGFQVAQTARAMGMITMTFDRHTPKKVLGMIMSSSDFVTLHLSEDGNHAFIDKDLIALMKPTAFLINTARPSLVDEKALTHAVFTKKIAGAAMDGIYAFSSDSLNMIVTPHVAGRSFEDRVACDEFMVEKTIKDLNQSPGTKP